MSTKPELDKNFFKAAQDWLTDLFDLHDEDKAHERDTKAEIKKGIVFRGANLWILIFAMLVCSVGLNVNSTAVIIGAMLISPIMGPIMGIGLGMGTNDFELIVKALKNLAIAVVISIVASALYFWLSPLNEAQSEILARTSPNFWDVLIAFFGGTAGIVAGSRKEKSNAVPGVAIATALMPPLCTAGYGIATAQWSYFFGAFYLFSINCVFISLSTYMIVRVLRYRKKQFEQKDRERRVKRYIAIIAVLTIIPSLYTGIGLVKKSVFEQNATKFINEEVNSETCTVLYRNLKFSPDGSTIEVTLYGDELEEDKIAELNLRKANYGLKDVILNFRQDKNNGVNQEDFQNMQNNLRSGLIEDLYKNNVEQLKVKDLKIAELEKHISVIHAEELSARQLMKEAMAIEPQLLEFSLSESIIVSADSLKADTVMVALTKFSKKARTSDIEKLENWLKARTGKEKVKLVQN